MLCLLRSLYLQRFKLSEILMVRDIPYLHIVSIAVQVTISNTNSLQIQYRQREFIRDRAWTRLILHDGKPLKLEFLCFFTTLSRTIVRVESRTDNYSKNQVKSHYLSFIHSRKKNKRIATFARMIFSQILFMRSDYTLLYFHVNSEISFFLSRNIQYLCVKVRLFEWI